ncbi:DUF6519 domain-containing protein [Paraburkholderia sp. J10-1]|uniref:DUF6519 domain-containing protein n=1 Tax=Paraburkholderia sp. J10-1 TaxID=2805430 RepID=UPI002AB767B7|nr:DUF6519 domain-containing protein [Paraburkholderia sp. J10-1]
MKNIDISRDSFEALNGFSRVVWQQGRVQLDADLNEQASIMLHTLRTMMVDLAGRFGGPFAACGFRVMLTEDDLTEEIVEAERDEVAVMLRERARTDLVISRGRYYVDGLLCENHRYIHYSRHAGPEHRERGIEEAGCYLVYLDVWEREITALDTEAINEVALGGADTAARMQVVWQVRTVALRERAPVFVDMKPTWADLVGRWQGRHRGKLRSRAREGGAPYDDDPVGGRHTYRGPENQLYRVEIHCGGKIGERQRPSFKFSRENGTAAFRVESVSEDGLTLTLREWARDDTLAIAVGQFVELVDEDSMRYGAPGALPKVAAVDPLNRQVKLDTPVHARALRTEEALVLRRWDQQPGEPRKGGLELSGGAALIVEDDWLTLEAGIEILFERAQLNDYRSGDYWLIPARVATGDVIWPDRDGEPEALPPQGVQHHYAPLAIVETDGGADGLKMVVPLTRRFGARNVDVFDYDAFVFDGER